MSEEMKQSFPNPICPYCGMNMKSGDGYWWCMNKVCHEQLYPNGIAQTSDWKEGTAQTGEAKPVQPSLVTKLAPRYFDRPTLEWCKEICRAYEGHEGAEESIEDEIDFQLDREYASGKGDDAPHPAPSSSAGELVLRCYKCQGLVIWKHLEDGETEFLHSCTSSASAGWIVASETGLGLKFRTMEQGQIMWTLDRENALRFARREDAEKFAAEDEDAWKILPVSSGSASEYETVED